MPLSRDSRVSRHTQHTRRQRCRTTGMVNVGVTAFQPLVLFEAPNETNWDAEPSSVGF